MWDNSGMNRLALALPLLALGACTATPTLVDMTDVNPVTYQHDLDHCELIGTNPDPVGPIVAGAVIGASIGLGAGAFAYGTQAVSVAEGYGAAAGATAGAGTAAAVNEGAVTPPEGVPKERMSVADCLRAKGYKVLPPQK
jgi:hypothetical protein